MSRHSAHRTYPPRKLHIPHYDLQELFSDDELALKLLIAEHRILKAFAYATHRVNGRDRGTDNCIIGVGPRQKDLVAHVIDKVVIGMRSWIVTASELPAIANETTGLLRGIARDAERRLIAVQVSRMTPHKIWFDDWSGGYWSVAVSAMDTYRLNRQIAAEAHRVDQRLRRESLHGGGRVMVVH